jgi:hypothetical protein
MISPSRQPRKQRAPKTTVLLILANIGKTAQERCAKIDGGRNARQSGEFHAR